MDAARLRRDADIAAVWSEGTKIQHAFFTLRARPNGTRAVRVAVSAPRTLGRAVKRNRARRRLREALRLVIRELDRSAGYDVVAIARTPVESAPFAELREAAAAVLRSVPA